MSENPGSQKTKPEVYTLYLKAIRFPTFGRTAGLVLIIGMPVTLLTEREENSPRPFDTFVYVGLSCTIPVTGELT